MRRDQSSPDISPISPAVDYAKKYRPGLGASESPISPAEPHFGGSDSSRCGSPASIISSLIDKYDYTRPPISTVDDIHYLPQEQGYDTPHQGKPDPINYSIRGPYAGERPVTLFPTVPQLKNRLSRPFDDPVTQFPGAEYSPPPPVPRLPTNVDDVDRRRKKTDEHADNPRIPEGQEGHHRRRHHRADREYHHHPRDVRTPSQKTRQSRNTKEAIQHIREEYELRPWAKSIKEGILKFSKIKTPVLPPTYDVGQSSWNNEKFR